MVLRHGSILWRTGGLSPLLGLDALRVLCHICSYCEARPGCAGTLRHCYPDGDRDLLIDRPQHCLQPLCPFARHSS